jgi:methionyl-tRNA formyltransferase
LIIIFGSSYIKGDLIDKLVGKKAINIHMGISPYYRGSSCNFWALYDKKPELVGATIHYISKGLDSGKVLFHALPKPAKINSFVLGMQAVWATQESLIEKIMNNELFDLKPIQQNKNLEIRYSKNAEFTDEIASNYLKSLPLSEDIFKDLSQRNIENFINPSIK